MVSHFTDVRGSFRIQATTLSLRLALTFTQIMTRFLSVEITGKGVGGELTFVTETLPLYYDQVMTDLPPEA
jgi:hypothetical protein